MEEDYEIVVRWVADCRQIGLFLRRPIGRSATIVAFNT